MLLAFVHVAKTGGQTVETMLRGSYGARYCDAVMRPPPAGADPFDVRFVVPKFGPDDLRQAQRLHPGLKGIGGHAITLWSGLETVRPDTRYFCLLREPVARGASHFQFHRRNDRPCLDWEGWLRWEVPRNHQTKMLSPDGSADDALARIARLRPFIGLMERFDESLVMLKRFVAPDLNIAYYRRNTAPDNALAKSLLADPQQREALRLMHLEDLKVWEFVTNELYPAWQREYGPTLERDVEEFRRHREAGINRLNVALNRGWHRYVYRPLERALR